VDSWERFFFVLTDIGLISFKVKGKLIPIKGLKNIIKIESEDFKNCLKLTFNKKQNNIEDQIFATSSSQELKLWVKALQRISKITTGKIF
jgi:hypothetical protein